MARLTAKSWGTAALQAVLLLAFGLIALILPGMTAEVLVLVFGAFVLVWGIAMIARGVNDRASGVDDWWIDLATGVIAVAVGILAFVAPAATVVSLVYLVGAFAFVTGIAELIEAFRSRFPNPVRWAFGISGLLSVFFGLLILFVHPAVSAVAVIWIIGIYALISAAVTAYRAWRLYQGDSLRAVYAERSRAISEDEGAGGRTSGGHGHHHGA